MARMVSMQVVIESTMRSLMSAGLLLLLKRGLAETVRATHSLAERTSGRTAAFFCPVDMCGVGRASGTLGGSGVCMSMATLTMSESPATIAGVMYVSLIPHASF